MAGKQPKRWQPYRLQLGVGLTRQNSIPPEDAAVCTPYVIWFWGSSTLGCAELCQDHPMGEAKVGLLLFSRIGGSADKTRVDGTIEQRHLLELIYL